MTCFLPQPVYISESDKGVYQASPKGDGYTIALNWYLATPDTPSYSVVYNVYYSTIQEDVFAEGVKYVILDTGTLSASFVGFAPGKVYYFAVRATEFETAVVRLSGLPEIDGFKIYPEGQLLSNITDESLQIPVQDVELFPPYGVLQIGAELITYTSVDVPNNNLLVGQRGVYNTEARLHTVDGYDGIRYYDNPFVRFFNGFEEENQSIVLANNKFVNQYAVTAADGYKEKVSDILNTDLTSVEIGQADFLRFDYAGWRRTRPADILAGKCVGSYYGGQYYCADGYNGIGRQVRGISISDANNQRQEQLLETTGRPCLLVRRIWTGKYSKHYSNTLENTAHRGLDNYGTHMVMGYEQFFNPRRSDGRIMVRFGPAKEDLVRDESGLESKVTFDCWTLTYPPIRDSDFIIKFDEDGNEEFRYEVTDVTRNDTLLIQTGAQKFTAVRVRKTDPIYQFLTIRDTSTIPTSIVTGLGWVSGPGGIPPHIHSLVINENIVDINQINQTTGITQGHAHSVVAGVVQAVLGHSHSLIL